MLRSLRSKTILFAGCMLNKVSASYSGSSGTYSTSDPEPQSSALVSVKIHSQGYEPSFFSKFRRKSNNEVPATATLNLTTNIVTIKHPGFLDTLDGFGGKKAVQQNDTFKTMSVDMKKKKHIFQLGLGTNVRELFVQMILCDESDQFQTWISALGKTLKIPVSFNTISKQYPGDGFIRLRADEMDYPKLEIHVDPKDEYSAFRHDRLIKTDGKHVFKYAITHRVNQTREFKIEPLGNLLTDQEEFRNLEMIQISFGRNWEWARLRVIQRLRDLGEQRNRQEIMKLQATAQPDKTSEELMDEYLVMQEKVKGLNPKGFDLVRITQFEELKKELSDRGLLERVQNMIPKQIDEEKHPDEDSDFGDLPDLPEPKPTEDSFGNLPQLPSPSI